MERNKEILICAVLVMLWQFGKFKKACIM